MKSVNVTSHNTMNSRDISLTKRRSKNAAVYKKERRDCLNEIESFHYKKVQITTS